MIWHLYVLKCCDGSFYTGITLDPVRRIQQHNMGKGSKYVRSRLPAVIVSVEPVGPNKGDALHVERKFKDLSKSKKEFFVQHGISFFIFQVLSVRHENKIK